MRHGRAFPISPLIQRNRPIGIGSLLVQTFNETLTIVDTIGKRPNKILNETVTLVDTISKLASRTLAEVVTLVDTLSKTPSRTFNESFTIVDVVNKAVSRTLAEVVTIVDSIVTQAGKAIVLSETITIVDIITKQNSRSLNENVTVVDSISKRPSRIFNESFTIVDTIRRTINRSFTEIISIRDGAIPAVNLNGVNSYINWGNILTSETQGTFMFRMRLYSMPSASSEIPFGYGNTRWFFIMGGGTPLAMRFSVKISGAEKTLSALTQIELHKNYTLTATYDPAGGANNLQFRIFNEYGDLFASGENTHIGNIDTTAQPLRAGHDANRNFYQDMVARDFRIYDRILTPTEQQDFSKGIEPSDTSLLLRAKANEQVGSTVADDSGNGFTGTLVGGYSWVDWDRGLVVALTRTLAESITIVDTIRRAVSRSLNEAVTIVDTIRRSVSRIFGESVTVVDRVAKNPSRNLTESFTVVDTITRAVSRALNEVVTITDLLIAAIPTRLGVFKTTLMQSKTITALKQRVGSVILKQRK